MKKKYEVRVAYVVYDYYNVVAESEEEAIEKAKEQASEDSLNDFQLQETNATIEEVNDVDTNEEGEEPLFEVCFWHDGTFYRQPVFESNTETDSKNPEAWYCPLESNKEDIQFTLFGIYDDQEDAYQYPRTITTEELEVRVFNNKTWETSWITDVEIGK